MAWAFAQLHGHGCVEAYSAGSRPAKTIHAEVIQVMQERGVALTGLAPHGISAVKGVFDVVVSMECGDACPTITAAHREEWQIPDPAGQTIERTREIRDQIESEVVALLECFKMEFSKNA